jgi:hypothetical protein
MTQDCQFFTVIKTIYHVRIIDGRLVYASHSLPVESVPREFVGKINGKLQRYEKTPAELTYKDFDRFSNDSLKHVRLYWIHLDDRGENLCYATQERSSPTSLKIYRIRVPTGGTLKIETELVAERSFWTRDIAKPYGDRDFKEFEMCFHPDFPIVVYACAKGTYVWNFTTSKSRLSSCSSADGPTNKQHQIKFPKRATGPLRSLSSPAPTLATHASSLPEAAGLRLSPSSKL